MESSHSTSTPAPELPVEIWTHVFRFATAIPDPILRPHVSWRAYIPNSRPSLAEQSASSRRYEQALATKLVLVQVCRQWNILARPLLYEHVVLKSTEGIQSMLDTVSDAPTIRADSGLAAVGFGALVKRLDLLTKRDLCWCTYTGPSDHFDEEQGQSDDGSEEDEEDSDSSAYTSDECDDEYSIPEEPRVITDVSTMEEGLPAQLCRALPNLTTIVFRHSHPENFNGLPLSEIFPRLEVMYPLTVICYDTTTWVESLKRLPRVINLQELYFADEFDAGHLEGFDHIIASLHTSFPAIEEFNSYEFWRCTRWISKLPSSTFPKLQRVFFSDPPPSPNDLRMFTATFGRSLTFLRLYLSEEVGDMHHQAFEEWATILKETCPKLSELRLVVGLPDTTTLPETGCVIETVTTFGYQRQLWSHPIVESAPWQPSFDDILHYIRYFPNLQRIRLMEEDDLEAIRNDQSYTNFLMTCGRLGLEVVDEIDQTLNSVTL